MNDLIPYIINALMQGRGSTALGGLGQLFPHPPTPQALPSPSAPLRLPPPSGSLPSTIVRSGPLSVLRGAAPALGAALPGVDAAMAAGAVMSPQPTNQGEVPFYTFDPKTGAMVPNSAAFPQVGSGYGGGNQSPANMRAMGSPSMGAGYPMMAPPPMPHPRPNTSMPKGYDLAQGGAGSPQQSTGGPGLIQKFISLLQQGNDPNSPPSSAPGGPFIWGFGR